MDARECAQRWRGNAEQKEMRLWSRLAHLRFKSDLVPARKPLPNY